MFNKTEVRGYLIAAKGAGMLQLFAILMGIPELYRLGWFRGLCWVLIGLGAVLALVGLFLAANHEVSKS